VAWVGGLIHAVLLSAWKQHQHQHQWNMQSYQQNLQ
jgi:hypothetical protein